MKLKKDLILSILFLSGKISITSISNDLSIFLYAGYTGLNIATLEPLSKHDKKVNKNAPEEPVVTKFGQNLFLNCI